MKKNLKRKNKIRNTYIVDLRFMNAIFKVIGIRENTCTCCIADTRK